MQQPLALTPGGRSEVRYAVDLLALGGTHPRAGGGRARPQPKQQSELLSLALLSHWLQYVCEFFLNQRAEKNCNTCAKHVHNIYKHPNGRIGF